MVYNYTKAHTTLGTDMSWRLMDSATVGNFRAGAGQSADDATMVFKLYGPFAPTDAKSCGDDKLIAAATEIIKGVTIAGPIKNTGYVVTDPGTYRWVVSYSGDAYNDPAATTCGAESHTITVISPEL